MKWRLRIINIPLSIPTPGIEKYAPKRHPTLGSKPGWGDAYWRVSGDGK
jgi:hypothetical protein